MLQKVTHNHILATPKQALLTDDRQRVLRFAAEALTAGMAAALVTLVEVRGGAARRPGAQMAVREDGAYCGFVSGGCVEAAAAYEALEALACGDDRKVIYGVGSPWFDIVLPCGGGITLAVHCLKSVTPLLAVLNQLTQRQPAGLRYSSADQSLQFLAHAPQSGWQEDFFTMGYRPATRVVIFGHSVEAQATASIAKTAGYDVQTSDTFTPRLATLVDADTAVILLLHDLDIEQPVLEVALAAKPFYIGAMGSQRTHLKRVQRLQNKGWSEKEIARIKAPIGIFPKARDAYSLALSVLADVAAARHQQGNEV
ncbi:XdhC family protein [Escherichia fergusonii]|uniref:XdhC family protein n=1 Tax=Escherichia fergusonii TaxID=564 RepID=UPI003F6DE148